MNRNKLVPLIILFSLVGSASAVSVPATDPTYIPHDDFLAWNWKVLEQVIPGFVAPSTPSGNTDLIRLFANYANDNPKSSTLDFPVVPGPGTDMTQSAQYWYGLGYDKQTGQVEQVLTAATMLSAIQTLTGNPNAVTPIFGFDQSQTGGSAGPANTDNWNNVGGVPVAERDIWLRGRLLLVPDSALQGGLASLIGLTPAQVNALIDPLVPAPSPLVTPGLPGGLTNPAPSVFEPGVDPSGVVAFYFRDTLFNDFTDPAGNASHPTWNFNWSFLPGYYDVNAFLDPFYPPTGLPDYSTVDQGLNTGGARMDWGGYLPGLDLTNFLSQDYAFLLSLETFGNNNGDEEAYIVGAFNGVSVPPPGVIPEPLTVAALAMSLTAAGAYIRKRRIS